MADITTDGSPFAETLPEENCPPELAVKAAYGSLWRYVSNNPPTECDFQSHAALRPNSAPPKGRTLCEWSSCSLFIAENRNYKRLPKPARRYKYIAEISITNVCGYTLSNGKHVDFWRFKDVKPNVVKVYVI